MEKQKIEQKADALLKQFGYNTNTDTYIDIVKLARSVGFRVGETRLLPFKEDGFISISKDRQKMIIGVNNDRSVEEKRFIVAHEIAHYILHYKDRGISDAIMHREHVKGKDAQENDADFFAACILMPRDSFLKYYQALHTRGFSKSEIIDYLQAIFRTPKESIKRRIEEVC